MEWVQITKRVSGIPTVGEMSFPDSSYMLFGLGESVKRYEKGTPIYEAMLAALKETSSRTKLYVPYKGYLCISKPNDNLFEWSYNVKAPTRESHVKEKTAPYDYSQLNNYGLF